MPVDDEAARLRLENEDLRKRLELLEAKSAAAAGNGFGAPDAGLYEAGQGRATDTPGVPARGARGVPLTVATASTIPAAGAPEGASALNSAQIARYSRHLLVPAVGVKGQSQLLGSSVLVVGAGGLGAAVLPYLAGAGVGHIGTMDFDQVDISNLHRQVLYGEGQAGESKALCAAQALRALNSNVRCTPMVEALGFDNALDTVRSFDVVVDASDNPRTRYLVNDACVLAGKPLVSASALGMEGQVTVYNHRDTDGPCYRCVFPKPLSTEVGRSCSDNGVMGPVPGVLGCLQAVEALKVLGGFGRPLAGMLNTFDANDGSFYCVKLKPRNPECAVCGNSPSIRTLDDTRDFCLHHRLIKTATDDAAGCARGGQGAAGAPGEGGGGGGGGGEEVAGITVEEYARVRAAGTPHLLLDVRSRVQFDICSLPGAVNIPFRELADSVEEVERLRRHPPRPPTANASQGGNPPRDGTSAGSDSPDSHPRATHIENNGTGGGRGNNGGQSGAAIDVDAAAAAAGGMGGGSGSVGGHTGSGGVVAAVADFAAGGVGGGGGDSGAISSGSGGAGGHTAGSGGVAAASATDSGEATIIPGGPVVPVYCLCRRGVDSRRATALLAAVLGGGGGGGGSGRGGGAMRCRHVIVREEEPRW